MPSVPAAVLGERRLPIMHVDQLREFLGLPESEDSGSYPQYIAALERVLDGVERAVLQVPPEHFRTPTPNRGRDLAELVFNIHDAIAAMGESLDSGSFRWKTDSDFERSRRFSSTGELAQFCREVRSTWHERALDVSLDEAAQPVETAKGPLTNQQVMESQAFHAAQHLRQIYVFLRQIGVEPAGELQPGDLKPIELGDLVF